MPDPAALMTTDILPNCVPLGYMLTLKRFLSERKTGNIRLNIKDGKILGWNVEEIHSAK